MSVTYPTPTLDRATLNFDPVADTDAVRKGYVTTATGAYLPLAGGTVSGTVTHQGTSALNGATTVGTTSAATSLIRNGPNNSARIDEWQNAGVKKWRWQVDGSATGGNAGDTFRLFGFDDTGTSLGEVARYIRASGSITWNNGLSYSDPFYTAHGGSFQYDKSLVSIGTTTLVTGVAMAFGGANPSFQWVNKTYAGVLDTGSGAPNFATWTINDTVNASRALPASAGFAYGHNYQTGANGDRIQMSLVYNKTAAASDGLTTSPMNLACFMHHDVGESTNPAAPLTTARSVNIDCRIGGTGNAFLGLLLQENDMRTFAGNTVRSRINLALHCGNTDAVHGSLEDCHLKFSSSPLVVAGTGGVKTLIQIGSWTQWHPWDETLAGTSIMQVGSFTGGIGASGAVQAWNPTVDLGFDLWGLKFTTSVFRSQGINIDGTGQVPILGPGAITYSAAGVKIAVPNVLTTAVAIAVAGTGYRVNDVVVDIMGNLVQITGVTGSTPSSVSLVRTGYAAAAPTNPVTTQFGCGTGLTLNLTTAATGSLNLSDTGQKLGFFGTTAVVKPTVTGSKGANAALASLLTALANFGLLTDSST
jgi:hypothetical protein